MYNTNEKNNQLTNLLTIFLVSVLIFYILVLSFSNNSSIKDISNKFMNNTLILEITNTSDETTKGTGLLINNTTVVSVAHLFDDNEITILGYLYDKKIEYSLTLIRKDDELDLALLSIDDFNDSLNKIDYAELYDINYSDEIVKIGNALGYGLSIDVGIVANPYLKLEVDDYIREVVNISINIRNGDSGGPVFNLDGQLIGLISFKTNTGLTSSDGLSFIVPSFIIQNFIG